MAGWISRKMLETYSHSRMEAKMRVVASFDAVDVDENSPEVGTKSGHNSVARKLRKPQVF
jgi:hypothetical protein